MSRICAALACALALIVSTAFAGSPPREKELDATVAYLQNVQNVDGGFGYEFGKPSDPMFSSWVALALAAFGVNPKEQARPGGGTPVLTYLQAHTAELELTTDWSRTALVAIAAGVPARNFGGTDLVARLLDRRLPNGAFKHRANDEIAGVNDTAFAVLAFSEIDDPEAKAAIGPAVDWLLTVQGEDGAWGWSPDGKTPSSDMTAAVIQALIAGGRAGTPQQQRGFDYIRTRQRENGGFAYDSPSGEPNTASTAWVAQAMWAAGIDPGSWRRSGGDPLDFLADMQQPDGSVPWTRKDQSGTVWMTAYAAPAFAGRQLPIKRVPDGVKPPTPTATPSVAPTATGTPAATPGQDGFQPTPSDGVKSGGGGKKAPLFSQPLPQSQGRTRGGARQREQAAPRATATPKRTRQHRASTRARSRSPQRPSTSPVPAASATATSTPTPTPTAVLAAGAQTGDGLTLAGDPDSANGSGGGGSGLPYVRGTIVSASVDAALMAGAPGLRGAGSGGTSASEAARLIAALLLIALACGWIAERRGVTA